MKHALPFAFLLAACGGAVTEPEAHGPTPTLDAGGAVDAAPEERDGGTDAAVDADATATCVEDCPTSPCARAGTRSCQASDDVCHLRIIVRCRVDGCEWRTYSSLTPYATPEQFRAEREMAEGECRARGGALP